MASCLKWVNSNGGPLILLGEDLLLEWSGTDLKDEEETDYDRICEVREYAEKIQVGHGWGIAFGDEPMSTAWMPFEDDRGGDFVRWGYGPSEEIVARHLQRISEDIFPATELYYRATCERCILFDSAYSGADFEKGEFEEIQLKAGQYAIQMVEYKPEVDTWIIIHRFSMIEPAC
jgi:hypothetical protein